MKGSNATILSTKQEVYERVYRFHDVPILCRTNRSEALPILESLLAPSTVSQGSQSQASYDIFCYENYAAFPTPLPSGYKSSGTVRLLSDTVLKFYQEEQNSLEYQAYTAQPGINATTLSIIDCMRQRASTHLEALERYTPTFLRRYIVLLALGRLMQGYGFVPCHGAVVTAMGDASRGILILGGSGSGKTTLSLGCASKGHGLLGDDLVMLRQEATDVPIKAYRILPEISVRAGTLTLYHDHFSLEALPVDKRGKRYCEIDAICQAPPPLHTTIQALIFPSLSDTQNSMLLPLTKAQTLKALIETNCSKGYASQQERSALFAILGNLAEQAAGYRLIQALGSTDGPGLLSSLL